MTEESRTNNETNQDTVSVYQELVNFLQQTQRLDVRLEATRAVLQVIHDRNQVLQLLEHNILLPLLRVVSDCSSSTAEESLEACRNSLQALLFLTSSTQQLANSCVEEMIQNKAVPRLIEVVFSVTVGTHSSREIVNLSLAILANLTRAEEGAVEFVGKTMPEEAVKNVDLDASSSSTTLHLLLDRFLNREMIFSQPNYGEMESHEWDTFADDPYQHFAAILMNVTQLESGRKFVLKIPKSSDSKSVFEILLMQLKSSPNPLRRRGISGMIRNCCLEQEAAWWMLNVTKVLTPLLYPLAGPEELDWDEKQGMDPDLWLEGPDKQREIDESTRQHIVEAILLLCATGRQSRKTLRLARTYVILKYADMVEESEAVSERINECVQYLRRDEEGMAEGSSDKMIEEEYSKMHSATKLKLLPSSQVGSGLDYDDVD